MYTFNDFKKMATDASLNLNEKVGFPDIYRKKTEKYIFPDVQRKLKLAGTNQVIMDIGCGCSEPVLNLIEFCRQNNHLLYLIDSKEMLDNIPDEDFVNKIACEFPDHEQIDQLHAKIDYIVVYSVLHHVVYHANYIAFLDTIVELLKPNGKALIADLTNISKKKRFLSSPLGIKFHKEWANSDENPEIYWNQLEKSQIDDSIIFSILQRYRNMGCETYLMEQEDGLPMNKTREDILIKKL